jgi:ergothioneine biosynthesis protein EgtB
MDADALATALRASRADTLATFAAFERRAEGLRVPRHETINPPLWELGHLGWFQEFWVARNPQRAHGAAADPAAPRAAGVRSDADQLYDSSRIAHATRWSLPLPDADGTRDDLARQLAGTLQCLRDAGSDDASLYFHRLVLAHEDMHHEAALYTAQHLGIAIDDPRWQPAVLTDARATLALEAGSWVLGYDGPGFAFDNELAAHTVPSPAIAIDRRVLSWAEFLPFVEAESYRDARPWSDEGRAWLAASGLFAPRYLRYTEAGWERWRHGSWGPLNRSEAACHLTWFEAEAWCRWAGRRLPTEAEWERAAIERPDAFAWGEVWEWTASSFVPYPGFVSHSYRDYSAPWFGSHAVLRGASFMTQPRMRHPRYRNFFRGDRNDVPAGFRTCRA